MAESYPFENTVGKGEIARYEQFLLFPQCFQKARFPGASKGVIVWEWVDNWWKRFFNKKWEKKWERKKLYITCVSSFPLNVSNQVKDKSTIFNHLILEHCSFVKNLSTFENIGK